MVIADLLRSKGGYPAPHETLLSAKMAGGQYASSACEMVAEVLQYFQEGFKLSPAEADCIYAGILIDTNNFMTKTGVRTFEAAAYLRRSGAEVTRVRKMLRNDMACYKARVVARRRFRPSDRHRTEYRR